MKLNIKSFFILFVILTLIKLTNNQLNQEEDKTLRNWLKKLVINIPEKEESKIKLQNIIIDNILLGGIKSEKEK